MKVFNSIVQQGTVILVLAFGFGIVGCNREQPLPIQKEFDKREDVPSVNPTPDPPAPVPTPPDPSPIPEPPIPTPAPVQEGVYVMLETEDVVTGHTTRAMYGEAGYNVTPYGSGENGDVQVQGLGFITKTKEDNNIRVELSFYAKKNVAFYGWSWRYSDDPKGMQRGSSEDDMGRYVKTLALQTESGLVKLVVGGNSTSFTCQYHPNGNNYVYVKVRYAVKEGLSHFPKIIDFSPDRAKEELKSYVPSKQDNEKAYNRAKDLYLDAVCKGEDVVLAINSYRDYLASIQKRYKDAADSAYNAWYGLDCDITEREPYVNWQNEDEVKYYDSLLKERQEFSDLNAVLETSIGYKVLDIWTDRCKVIK